MNKTLETMKLKASLYSGARFLLFKQLEEAYEEARNKVETYPTNEYFIGELKLLELTISLVQEYLDNLIDTALYNALNSKQENDTNE